MKGLLLFLPFVLSAAVQRVKSLIPEEDGDGLDSEGLQSAKPESESVSKAACLDDLIKSGSNLSFEQLNTKLGEVLAESSGLLSASAIIISNPVFQTDQLAVIKEAIAKRFDNYLKCMLNIELPWWQNEEDRHWFLAVSYRATWYDKELWDAHRPYLNWKKYMSAVIKADNVALTVFRPKTFKAPLESAEAISKFIEHDSVALVQNYVKDLSLLADKIRDMAAAGSIKIMRLLLDYDITLDMRGIALKDVFRHMDVLSFMHSHGYQITPSRDELTYLMKKGMVAHLEFISKIVTKVVPTLEGVRKAAIAGHLGVLQWADSRRGGRFPGKFTDKRIAKNGHLDVLQWLFENDPERRKIGKAVFLNAASRGHLNILDWAYNTDPTILKRCKGKAGLVVNYVSLKGKLEVLQWLHNKDSSLFPDTRVLIAVMVYGHVNVLEWASDFIHPIFYIKGKDLDNVAARGQLDSLKWAHSKDKMLIPTIQGANWAAVRGHILVLEWLSLNGLYPDQIGLDSAIKAGCVASVHWIAQNLPALDPSARAIRAAVVFGRLGVIKYIHKTKPELLNHSRFLKSAKDKQWKEIIDFLETNVDVHSPTEAASMRNPGRKCHASTRLVCVNNSMPTCFGSATIKRHQSPEDYFTSPQKSSSISSFSASLTPSSSRSSPSSHISSSSSNSSYSGPRGVRSIRAVRNKTRHGSISSSPSS